MTIRSATMPRAAVAILFLFVAGLALSPPSAAGERDDARRHIDNAMPAAVMVIAVDVQDGELVPISSGSGAVVTNSGTLLTNHHVIASEATGRPHDAFVVARLRAPRAPLEIACAGIPEHGKLAPSVDLALVQCEFDLDGLPYEPRNWPSVSVGDAESITPGQRLWVLGYPDAGGLALRDSFGQVLGWTGEDGRAGDTYIKTDAVITHGNSGGAAVDARGDLIGVPSAYRIRQDAAGGTSVVVGSVGLIRPIAAAEPLLEAIRAGWRPGPESRERGHGDTPDEDDRDAADDTAEIDDEAAPDSEAESDGDEAADEASSILDASRAGKPQIGRHGVIVASRVVDARSGEPVADAVVAVLETGSDPRRETALRDAVAFARTDATGVFRFEAPLPRQRTYPVVVSAKGYERTVDPQGLELPGDAPQLYEPWESLALTPRAF